jgi:hypothetical protein
MDAVFAAPEDVDARGDHRIAMAAAVLSTALDGPMLVQGASCVAKSYPGFWEELRLTHCAVTGWPIAYTRSPEIHNAAFARAGRKAELTALPAETAEAALALARQTAVKGLAVTIPHKEKILPLLDEVTPVVREIGAVNTVLFRDGRTIGTNTDAAGVGVVEGLGYAQASTTVTTEAYVNITGRVTILDRYNTVNIRSDASGRRISTTGSSDMGGFSAKPDTSTYTNLTLKAGIIENEAVMLTVEARKVLITACNGELEVTENAYAKGSAAFGDVDSRVHFTAYLDTKVYLENADITGHERFQAQASSNPAAINGDNIDILSRMKLDAAGEGTAHYVVKIYPTAVVDIAPGFTYRGAEFIATRSLIKESRINYRARTSGFATQKKDPSYTYEQDGYVKAKIEIQSKDFFDSNTDKTISYK